MKYYQETLFDRDDFSLPGKPELLDTTPQDEPVTRPQPPQWNGVPRRKRDRRAKQKAQRRV